MREYGGEVRIGVTQGQNSGSELEMRGR